MRRRRGGELNYRARLFSRYLAVSLLPASFFLILGAAAVLISRNFILAELRGVETKTLGQVSAGVELVFSEADSLAVSLSTDPEVIGSLEFGLSVGIPSLADLRKARAVQSSFASAVNSRRYLHSIYATTFQGNVRGLMMASSEGITEIGRFPDASWIKGAQEPQDVMKGWTVTRKVRLLDNMDQSVPAITFYRNLIGPGDLSQRGVLAINMDLRKIGQLMAEGVEGSFADESAGGGPVLLDVQSRRAAAGKALSDADAGRLLDAAASGNFRSSDALVLDGQRYFVSVRSSERFPFAYALLTPEKTFQRVPERIFAVALVFAVLALALGGVITYAGARRNFVLLGGILDIIEAAGAGRDLPHYRQSKNEALDYVSLSVLQTFVEHDYYKAKLSEQELRRKTLELLALQAQMSPHFLFNTLTAISFKALAMTGKPNDLTRMVDHLSAILGYALEDPRTPVSLREEADHTRHYAEIQRLRFRDAVECSFDLDEDALDARCPRLLLQPLVENAAEHGKPAGGGPVRIRVSARLEESRVRLAVEDDGAGMDEATLESMRAAAAGEDLRVDHIGLANTLKRLSLTFGGDCAWTLESAPGKGTRVFLDFPYRSAAEPSGSGASAPGPAD